MNKITVEALRDIQLFPPIKKGERKEVSGRYGTALVRMGWAKEVKKPGRPKADAKGLE
jgi:hypothetical protein